MKMKSLVAIVLILAFLSGTPRYVRAASSVTTFVPTADTYVDSSRPASNFGSSTTVWIDGNSPTRRALLRFNLSGIPVGARITSATLKLYVASDGSGTAGSLKGVSGSWSEASVTYATAPTVGASIATIAGGAAPNSSVTVNLTSYVAGKTSINLYLVTSSTDGVKYYTREQGSTRAPTLTVTWTPATATPTRTATGTFRPTATPSSTPTPSGTPTPGPSITPSPTATASPTPTPGGLESLSLPLRLAFYFVSYPEAWTLGSTYPYTNYTPALGFYTSSDAAVIRDHVASMEYAHIQGGIVFWAGRLTPDDNRFAMLLQAASSGHFKWAIDYRSEASSDPSVTTIEGDLAYLYDQYASNPAYLRIGGKPVVFVHAGAVDGCGMADRWKQANTFDFYIVLKVFSGYPNCVSQPAHWHQYGPATDYDVQGSHSVSISPGYWVKGRAVVLPRDLSHWYQNIRNMLAARTDFQLITTWNGWTEGTQVESSNELGTAYLDALHNNGATASDPIVMAAGDIVCPDLITNDANCQQMAVSQLIVNQNPDAVLALGDLCQNTSANCFSNYYGPSWGRLFSITHPITGNHEYGDINALYYFDYWNGLGVASGRAGDRGKGFYSFDVGTWHIVALNSQCEYIGGCAPGGPQYTWLQQDLAAHPNQCTMAISHKPLFGSASLISPITLPLWQLLYQYNADVILDGHSHTYERFAPQDPNGVADPLRGIRELIVGTGGAFHTGIGAIAPNSEVRNATTFGALKLTLRPTGYDWQFIPIPGQGFTDSGTSQCH